MDLAFLPTLCSPVTCLVLEAVDQLPGRSWQWRWEQNCDGWRAPASSPFITLSPIEFADSTSIVSPGETEAQSG